MNKLAQTLPAAYLKRPRSPHTGTTCTPTLRYPDHHITPTTYTPHTYPIHTTYTPHTYPIHTTYTPTTHTARLHCSSHARARLGGWKSSVQFASSPAEQPRAVVLVHGILSSRPNKAHGRY
ncbi:hypothetical protein PMIN07_009327 [Paraphaeosphaeria minitans]